MTELRWADFARQAEEIAALGVQLLHNPHQGEVAILATVDRYNRPAVAPFCPIFSGDGLYLLAGASTPKVRHLQHNPAYALHALVGSEDIEFQIAGNARLVENETEREAVLAAVPFPSFDPSDPVFELLVRHALAASWPTPGQQQKQVWPSDSVKP